VTQKFVKRLFDVIAAMFGLAILSPLLAIGIALVKLEDGGPIFYRGIRVGLNGKLFRMYKLRTMVPNAESLGGSVTASDDHRITKAGQTLRKYKFDEIPQLINVLTGDMSIVGPRPEVTEYVDRYDAYERQILSVRPGITDWASIRFIHEEELYRGSSDPEALYESVTRPQKIALGIKYVRNHSLRTDISIIFETLRLLIRPSSYLVVSLHTNSQDEPVRPPAA
jgi:lipopolysaccharide/colanic/teichoic acid biosynthesis glycosyltransferase